jgi:hypothetical protein
MRREAQQDRRLLNKRSGSQERCDKRERGNSGMALFWIVVNMMFCAKKI